MKHPAYFWLPLFGLAFASVIAVAIQLQLRIWHVIG